MAVVDDGTRHVLGQDLLDLPDDLLALGDVALLRLLGQQLVDLWVAVLGVVAIRIAGIVFN